MRKWIIYAALVTILLSLTISCRQLFTTSVGSAFARDGISISNSTSVNDLLDLATGPMGGDPAAAKEILDVLAGKDDASLTGLSDEDKTTVLDLGGTAGLDMEALTGMLDGVDPEDPLLAERILDAFDPSVDTGALITILTNPTPASLDGVSVETIVLASAVIIADVAESLGASEVLAYLDDPVANPLTLTPEQQESLDLITAVSSYLDGRDEPATLGGFDLTSLLN